MKYIGMKLNMMKKESSSFPKREVIGTITRTLNEINNSQNPNTGDKSNVLKLSLIGITAIAGLVLLNRRKKNN